MISLKIENQNLMRKIKNLEYEIQEMEILSKNE